MAGPAFNCDLCHKSMHASRITKPVLHGDVFICADCFLEVNSLYTLVFDVDSYKVFYIGSKFEPIMEHNIFQWKWFVSSYVFSAFHL